MANHFATTHPFFNGPSEGVKPIQLDSGGQRMAQQAMPMGDGPQAKPAALSL